MSRLEQMSVQGIRSFGPSENDRQAIRFFTPLTLILGPNGTGKTTIIECLKYMTTGEMPPGGKKDGAFVHDPKIANDREVKAQIRLQFADVQGQICTALRSVSATQKLKKIEMKSIESLITRRMADGTKKSISNRCAEMDREMVTLLGVSRAVLDNVIFCHQEESNWPLGEGKALKQKFDDIFASTRYVKALEAIRKTRLDQNAVISNYKTEIKYLKQNKENAAQIEADLKETEVKRMSAMEAIQRIETQLKPTEEQLDKLNTQTNSIYELKTKVEKLKSEKAQMEKTQMALRDNIENEFQGSMEDLKQALAEFEGRVRKQEATLKQCESQLRGVDDKAEKLGRDRQKLLLDQGKLQQEAERNRQNVKARDSLIEKLAQQYELQEFCCATEMSEERITKFLRLLDEKAATYLKAANTTRAVFEEKEATIQRQVDQQRSEKTVLETQECMKIESLKKNRSELQSISSALSRADVSAEKLTDIERDLRQTESEVQEVENSVNVDVLRSEVGALTKEKDDFDGQLKRLDIEMNRMNREAGVRTQLELFRKDKTTKEEQIRRMRAKHADSIQHLFGEVEVSELKSKVDDFLMRQSRLVRASTSKMQALRQQLTQVDTNRRNQMDLLSVKEKELQGYEEKIFEVCDSQNFDEGLEKVQATMCQSEDTKGYLKGTEHVYQKYRTQLQREDPPCPLCHRPFDSREEVEELVAELSSKLSLVPDKLEKVNGDLDRFKGKYEMMLQLKPIRTAMMVLKEKDIPNLKTKIAGLKQEVEKLKSEISELEEQLESEQAEEETCKHLQPDVATIDRYLSEIRDLDRKIATQAAKLSGDDSERSMQTVTTEREDVQMNIETLNRNIERKRSRISEHADTLQRLKANANDLRTAKLRLEQELQQRSQLEDRRDALRAANCDIEAEVQEAKDQLKPIENEIRSLLADKEVLTSEKERRYEEDKKQFTAVKDHTKDVSRCQKETEAYLRSGCDEKLRRCMADKKRVDEAMEAVEWERDTLLNKMADINKELTTQKMRERELEDNLQLRKCTDEIAETRRQLEAQEEKLGGLDVARFNQERRRLTSELEELRKQQNISSGRLHGYEDEIRKAKADLQNDSYKDSEKKYRDKMIDLRTTEMAVTDLDKYYKALDRTIMRYHSTKMAEINKIIRELWRNTYRGNDIETIEIRSDEDDGCGASKTRRTYHYRVVTIRNGIPLDMRGRCSAGQKVLASLIIRLALAETFCLNCGVLALDEPTTNLDRENIASLAYALVEIIKSRSRQRNFQLVVITHDEDFVELLGRSDFVERFYKVRKSQDGLSQLVQARVDDIQMR